MSLINEALKRAEQDKLRNIAPTSYMPTLPPVHETRHIRLSAPVAGVLIVAILLVGSFATWRLIGLAPAIGTPDVANAAIVPTPSAPAAPQTAAVPAEPVTAASPAPTKEHASVEPLPEAPQPELPAVKSESEITVAAEAAVKDAFDKLVENTATPDAAPPAVPDKPQETQIAAEPAAPAAAAPEPKPEPAKPAPPKVIDYSKYKVTGIMRNSDGGTAIINGFFVKVGQTVEDATVVSIQENSVVLEIDGRKFTIRM